MSIYPTNVIYSGFFFRREPPNHDGHFTFSNGTKLTNAFYILYSHVYYGQDRLGLEYADSIPCRGMRPPRKIGCSEYDTKLYLLVRAISGDLVRVEYPLTAITLMSILM